MLGLDDKTNECHSDHFGFAQYRHREESGHAQYLLLIKSINCTARILGHQISHFVRNDNPFRFFLLSILILGLSSSAYPQTQDFQFERISIDEGLSHAAVNAIFQDSR